MVKYVMSVCFMCIFIELIWVKRKWPPFEKKLWIKIEAFWFRFHWSLFPLAQWIISHHRLSYLVSDEQARNQYVKLWLPSSMTHICITRPHCIEPSLVDHSNYDHGIPLMLKITHWKPRFNCIRHRPVKMGPWLNVGRNIYIYIYIYIFIYIYIYIHTYIYIYINYKQLSAFTRAFGIRNYEMI